jgi:hypothetical protein
MSQRNRRLASGDSNMALSSLPSSSSITAAKCQQVLLVVFRPQPLLRFHNRHGDGLTEPQRAS